MTRSAPRYATPSYRARKAARDPLLVRLGVLLAAGAIVAPIVAVIARSDGGEVVSTGNLPGAAVAIEPAPESTTPPNLAPVAPAPAPVVAGTVPATVAPDGTLPATVAPPTTAAPAASAAARADSNADSDGGGGSAGGGNAGAAAPAERQAPAPTAPKATTTAAPKPTAPPTTAPPPPRIFGGEEVQAIIRSVFPDDIEDHAILIAHRESRFSPTARNYCCIGLFQIYGSVHEKLINAMGFTVDQLTDPFVNAVVAYAIYQRSGWAPWGG